MFGVRCFHENFYGTPNPEETRRRGKKRQAKPKEEPENEVAVIGIHYRSFDDDSMAVFVNSPTALVPWNGDDKLLIDRYDVRHLLQDLSGIRRRRVRPPSPDATKEELDHERYRDLEGLEDPDPVPEDDGLKNEDGPDGKYQRVGFDYNMEGDKSTHEQRVDRSAEESTFRPPFSVPEHLLLKLPSTQKVHQIMAGTAKFVIEHGGQAEIVLRVKQASNPTFGFLMPDNYHHEYFRFLVDHPEYVGIGITTQAVPAVEVSSEEGEGGLSLLGTAYGDADDDEDESDSLQQEQQQVIDGETPGNLDEMPKEQSEGSSDCGSHSKKSSTICPQTMETFETALTDTGDSHHAAADTGISETRVEVAVVSVGEQTESVKVGSLARLREPPPPGTEALSSKVGENESDDAVKSPYHNPPVYKEPPVHFRRIIDKMVEFISRNGKEFESIVRERDKSDGRFPFLLQWNEYYPYFSQSLEAAQQASTSLDAHVDTAVAVRESQTTSTQGNLRGKQVVDDHFLNGVPYWDELLEQEQTVGSAEAGASEMQEYETSVSYNESGGMGFDAVMAAVRAATRGPPRAVEDGEVAASQGGFSETVERQEIGSDNAVLAAVRAATGASRRARVEDSAGGKVQPGQLGGPRGAGEASVRMPTEFVEGIRNEGEKPSRLLPWERESPEAFSIPEGDSVRIANVVAKVAALPGGQEGDSAGSKLASGERRKAERLRKAKIFAAMIREGNGLAKTIGQVSGPHEVATTNFVGRCDQGDAAVDVYTLSSTDKTFEAPKIVGDTSLEIDLQAREESGEAPEYLVEAEQNGERKNVLSTEKKLKVKSKHQDEKQRKHHHKKRKSHHDSDERRKDCKLALDMEPRMEKRHDHFQEDTKKDRRKHFQESELEIRDRHSHVLEGKTKEVGVFGSDSEEISKDYKEKHKDRRYALEADAKEKTRHGFDSQEKRKEKRYRHDEEGKERSSRYEHFYGEKRKESRHRDDPDRKGQDGRYHRDPEEKDSVHEFQYEERRKERRHSRGKRRKHNEENGLEAKEVEDQGHVSRKSKRHHHEEQSARKSSYLEKASRHDGDSKEEKRHKDGVLAMEEPPAAVSPLGRSAVLDEPSTSTPVDVPDDIRAKVRAMLALM